MSQLPPPVPYNTPDQTSQDVSNLNLLSIFYFIFCGLYGLVGLIPLIYVLFGLLVGVAGVAGGGRDAGAAAAFGGLFVCFGLFFSMLFWILSFLYYKAGRGLRAQKSLTLIYVVAVLACLNVPLGTVLGVFTFVVLSRPSVKALFETRSGFPAQ